jgi:putative FmdB family regulatory protein
MPLYTYACHACGEFGDWRPMSRSQEPAACPQCGEPAARAICAPSLALMPGNNRIAHGRNERAAHEPKLMTKDQLDRSGPRRAGLPGCHHHRGHAHGHGHDHGGGPGLQVHKSNRPWMIGH